MQRESLVYFAKKKIGGAREYGGTYQVGRHHLEWDELISDHDRVLIIAPRDHGKSHTLTVAYPIWKAVHGNRGDLGYIFGGNQDLADEQLDLVIKEITTNPKLKYLAPRNWKQTWAKKQIVTTTGVTIRARGITVRSRGPHPQWIICDDILSDEHMYSELIRRKMENTFFGTVSNMVVPGGQIVVVGTPLHEADLYAKIKKTGVYAIWHKPAVTPDGKVLWPLRYNLAALTRKKMEIGSIRYTREFLCEPISDDMSIFPRYLFQGEPVIQRAVTLGHTRAYWDALGMKIFIGVDIAMSAETGADYFVIFSIGVDVLGNRWVCDIERHKGMPYQAQLDAINRTGVRLGATLMYVEAVAAQRIWGEELIRTTALPIKLFHTNAQGTHGKYSLETGVPSLRILAENQKYRIPQGDARSVEETETWISEMVSFAWVDGKLQGVGTHDDTVMAFWMANQAANDGGFEFSFGDGETEGEAAELERMLVGTEGPVPGTPVTDGAFDHDLTGGYDGAEPVWAARPYYQR